MSAILDDPDFKLVRFLIADTGNVTGQLARHGWPVSKGKHTRHIQLGATYQSSAQWALRRLSWAEAVIEVEQHYLPPPGVRGRHRSGMALDEANFVRITDTEVKGTIEFGFMIGYKYRQKFRKNHSQCLHASWGFSKGVDTRKMMDALEGTFKALTHPYDDMKSLLEKLWSLGWRRSY